MLNFSYASWEDVRLLDMGGTCHINFKRDFFEELNEDVDGAVYFTDRSKIKSSRIDSIKLKILGFLDFMLQNVLYLLGFLVLVQ